MSPPEPRTLPLPFALQPSGAFDGNDGRWSTFLIRVSTPPQEFRVLVSTISSATWLPAQGGCESAHISSNCTRLRGSNNFRGGIGRGYEANSSSTFEPKGLYAIPLSYNLDMKSAYGFEDNISGYFGNDNISMPLVGDSIQQVRSQLVPIAEIFKWELFLGSVGLGLSRLNEQSEETIPLLESLSNSMTIPSRSWAYTAGAFYS
jgi:hypothetical protein